MGADYRRSAAVRRTLDPHGADRCPSWQWLCWDTESSSSPAVFCVPSVVVMDFHKLCTFETFRQVSGPYGYGGNLRDVIEQEFTRIKGNDRVRSWAAVVTERLAVNIRCSAVVNRSNIPGSCSSYFVSRVSAQGVLSGHFNQCVRWDKSHKILPSVTYIWGGFFCFFYWAVKLKALPLCPPNRKPPQL